MNKAKDRYLPFLLAIAAFMLQLFTPNVLGFHRDELLYFSMADHPAFGYYSVPPFTGLVAFISVKLFGYSLFAAKIFPAMAGGLLIMLIAMMARELRGGVFAQVLAVISFVSTLLFIRAFSLFQPVPFDIVFWALIMFLFLRFINNMDPAILYVLGLATGLAFLNKYNILFLVVSLAIAIVLTKHRRILVCRYFWIAVLIALIVALPNILWQYFNDFPVIGHMKELRSTQLIKMGPWTFLSEQILMVMPATLIIIPAFVWMFASERMKQYRVLTWACFIVLLLFLILHGKTYYSAGIYPFLTAAGGVFTEKYLKNNYLRGLIVILMLAHAYLMFPLGKPVLEASRLVAYFDQVKTFLGTDALRRDENNQYHPLPQDYSDMLGWDELAALTATAWNGCDPKTTVIYCENYGQAGAIAVLGKKYHLPSPVSFSESFIYWAPHSFQHEITTLIYINDEPGDDIKDLFSSIKTIGSISQPLSREKGTTVFLCTQPNQSFNNFYHLQLY